MGDHGFDCLTTGTLIYILSSTLNLGSRPLLLMLYVFMGTSAFHLSVW